MKKKEPSTRPSPAVRGMEGRHASALGRSGFPSESPGASSAEWSLSTPAERSGAIAIVQIHGDVGGAFARIGIEPVPVGEMRVRDLAGVDRGVVARVRTDMALLMPHAGREILLQLGAALTSAGIVHGGTTSALSRFPESRSPFEAELLDALARAVSPRAVDLLLDQPRRWAARGRPVPDPSTPAPDPVHSRRLDRLITPPLVAAIGASNIGKSTLLNRLCGRPVAATADEPGTTLDHVGSLVDLDGLVVRYVDTPGRRPDAPGPEREALALADALLPDADLVLRLGDRDHPPPEIDRQSPSLAIALRVDLGAPAWDHDAAVAASRGLGMAELVVLLRRSLVPDEALESPLPWRFWPARSPTPPGRPGATL